MAVPNHGSNSNKKASRQKRNSSRSQNTANIITQQPG
uniref:Uncharacterized protein n=1 Tax=Rhizophora mucronata TaxID=61149 RepID=A0A2P2JX20_RHIMU